ncbi:Putative hydroxypyruvate reductase [Polystyrenella longa]|uniref:Hydroxypyruvate reductase n=1 Tax=Polystyrenella longa TaxID=2528007 RepID=A0A518CK21_9PLAN|nr:DUF4147 domain-containing protein [Polystyrenella longa]QDU79575.1 Putative hydroxypyruvate reductase [Polystyrenella longa]
MKTGSALREDALAIWEAGVAAVDSARLVRGNLECTTDKLAIAGEEFSLAEVDRVIVVGTGKAGAGMAGAVEECLEPILGDRLSGWVNVPADCVRPLKRIHLYAARPAGVNEPTEEGVAGAQEILKRVRSATERDLVLVLISGGGSALLPAPVSGISLADKQDVTRFLASAGAPIEELNQVRRTLSEIKGGGLARAAKRAKTIVSLIISDVIGDPLDVIASGPTVETYDSSQQALTILEKRTSSERHPPSAVINWLRVSDQQHVSDDPFPSQVRNVLIGTNQVALQAAEQEATARGYRVISAGSKNAGEASEMGVSMMQELFRQRDANAGDNNPVCYLSGGEPTVTLKPSKEPSEEPRKGGRNQELVLAGLAWALEKDLQRIVLLSGGTDGEDGPTDAAGGYVDEEVRQQTIQLKLDPQEYLAMHNSYPFLEETGGLLKTGPTHTNVMDLRVGLVAQP